MPKDPNHVSKQIERSAVRLILAGVAAAVILFLAYRVYRAGGIGEYEAAVERSERIESSRY